ncbi:hypothetical protein L1987_63737 [Smallanthus sonchifolius]|uniref:Uncharacterized protein n=1 Tax=Smallanthus sonchifolius TaxID=185202 RepID=A0ACB9CE39_9ASTR|nr:hypothetical protein L1987_63737 [Smallanthus sonchifolius]
MSVVGLAVWKVASGDGIGPERGNQRRQVGCLGCCSGSDEGDGWSRRVTILDGYGMVEKDVGGGSMAG